MRMAEVVTQAETYSYPHYIIVMRSLRLETGKALSHAPDSLVAAARSLARALGSGAAFRSSS